MNNSERGLDHKLLEACVRSITVKSKEYPLCLVYSMAIKYMDELSVKDGQSKRYNMIVYHDNTLEEKLNSMEFQTTRSKLCNAVLDFSDYSNKIDMEFPILYDETLKYLTKRKLGFLDVHNMNNKEFKTLKNDIFYNLCEVYDK